jgi:hypothetical protein
MEGSKREVDLGKEDDSSLSTNTDPSQGRLRDMTDAVEESLLETMLRRVRISAVRREGRIEKACSLVRNILISQRMRE